MRCSSRYLPLKTETMSLVHVRTETGPSTLFSDVLRPIDLAPPSGRGPVGVCCRGWNPGLKSWAESYSPFGARVAGTTLNAQRFFRNLLAKAELRNFSRRLL